MFVLITVSMSHTFQPYCRYRFFVLQPLFADATSVLCLVLRLCWVAATVPVYGVQSGDVAASQRFETDWTWCNKLQLIRL